SQEGKLESKDAKGRSSALCGRMDGVTLEDEIGRVDPGLHRALNRAAGSSRGEGLAGQKNRVLDVLTAATEKFAVGKSIGIGPLSERIRGPIVIKIFIQVIVKEGFRLIAQV